MQIQTVYYCSLDNDLSSSKIKTAFQGCSDCRQSPGDARTFLCNKHCKYGIMKISERRCFCNNERSGQEKRTAYDVLYG